MLVAKEIVDCMYNFSTRNLFLAIFIFATSFSCQSISPEKKDLEKKKKKPKTSCYNADFLTHNRMFFCRCSSSSSTTTTKRKLLKHRKKYISKSDICYLRPFITTQFFLLVLPELWHLLCTIKICMNADS